MAGVETSPAYIVENDYQTTAPYLTSYGIISKFETLVASKRAWAALPSADQAAIRHAVADTRRHSGQLATREALELTRLCQQGVVLDQPTVAQLGTLARAAATAAPANAAAAAMERQIKALPGTGGAAGRDRGASRLPGRGRCCDRDGDSPGPDAATAHQGGGKIPPGTYVVTDTVADFQAGGQYGDDWEKDVTFTWHLHTDGTFYQSQVPDYPDQGPTSGHYVVKGDEVTSS